MKLLAILICVLFCTGITYIALYEFGDRVAVVHDGDTFYLQKGEGVGDAVRLAGVDAPELSQQGGLLAKMWLEQIVLNTGVKIRWTGETSYGRKLAYVYLSNGRCVNEMLVSDGMAWSNKWSPPIYQQLMHKAQNEKRGIWATDGNIPPYIYRKQNNSP